jgi:antitoxin component YwqK of YwqJK toxin-antitoxin module
MKPVLLSLLFLFVPKICISQVAENIKTIYLDSLWEKTSEGNHTYYRVIKDYYSPKKETYQIYDYYKSGVLEKEGLSSNKEGDSKVGEFIFYYENGKRKATTNYIKSRPNGNTAEWYENGNKKLEGEYIEDEKKHTSQIKINQFWDVNGVQKIIEGNGFYEDQGENEYSKGEIKDGFKQGDWEGSSKKPQYSYKETYKNGKLTSGVSTDVNGEKHNYKELEVKAEHKNGIMEFYQYVGKNYRTPNVAGLSGKIYVAFVVDTDGKIIEPKIIRDLGYGTGQEALRILQNYNDFIPGEKRGQKVRCRYTLPITIQTAQ